QASKPDAAQVERVREIRVRARIARLHRPRRMAEGLEAREPPRLGLQRIDRKGLMRPAARMRHMIAAAADGAPGPAVDQVEDERRMRRDGGLQALRRLPGAEAHARYRLAMRARRRHRQRDAVAGNLKARAQIAL